MPMHARAGQPAQPEDLIDVDEVVSAYYDLVPDPAVPAQKVVFGTSGHRGSSLDRVPALERPVFRTAKRADPASGT